MDAWEFLVAFRYLLTKQKDRFISVINIFAITGIALGVATLITVMSVMNGYEKELISKILGLSGHITVNSFENKGIPDYDALINKFKEIKNIKFLAPYIQQQAMIISDKGTSSGALIRGIENNIISSRPDIISIITKNQNKDTFIENSIILGKELARSLQVNIGDEIKLVSANVNYTLIGAMPKTKTFKVTALMDLGMQEYNASMAFIPLRWAQLLFNLKNQVTDIEFILQKVEETDKVKSEISQILCDLTKVDLEILDWRSSNRILVSALRTEQNVMFIILSLIILIAIFNIISGLVILVKDKSESIAILRTFGATKGAIMRIFIIAGLSIGTIATIIGSTLGIILSHNLNCIKEIIENITGNKLFDPNVYFLASLPSEISYIQILNIVLITLIMSLLATIYPSIKIANISPSKILRHE